MHCFQRDLEESVPGCSGNGLSGWDYCIPSVLTTGLHGWGGCGAGGCERCEGDCDSDSDCKAGLYCFHRNATEPVPGCSGEGLNEFDYCTLSVLSSSPPSSPAQISLVRVKPSHVPLVLQQSDLDEFKKLYPDNKDIQDMQVVTLANILEHTSPWSWGRVDFKTISSHAKCSADSARPSSYVRGLVRYGPTLSGTLPFPPVLGKLSVADPDPAVFECAKAIAAVVIDCVSLAIGAVTIRGAISPRVLGEVAEALLPILPKLQSLMVKIADTSLSNFDRAKAVVGVLGTVWSGGALGAVMNTIFGSLNFWQYMLYGVTAIATITAALATDGLALAAEIAVELATAAFLATDAYAAVVAC